MKKILRLLLIAAATAAAPAVALADPPPPPGCEYVMGVLICVDLPIG